MNPADHLLVQAVRENNPKLLQRSGVKPLEICVYSLPRNETNNNDFGLSGSGLSLAHIAAYYDSLECFVHIYTRTSGRSLTCLSRDSCTPLQYACARGSIEVATFILSCEPDVSLHGKNLLILAVTSRNVQIVKVLFDYAGKDAFTQAEFTLAHESAMQGHQLECVKLLLTTQPIRRNGDSLLMTAVRNARTEAVQILLDAGESPDFVTRDGETALYVACYLCNEKCVELLLDKLIEPDPARFVCKTGAIFWVCESHNVNIARMALEKGIDVNRLDSQNRMGVSKLVDRGSDEESIQIMQLMLDHGWELNNPKASALAIGEFMAGIKKLPTVVTWLIRKGSDLGSYLPPGGGRSVRVIDELETNPKWATVRELCAEQIREFRERESGLV